MTRSFLILYFILCSLTFCFGQSWQDQSLNSNIIHLNDIHFFDEEHGCTGGDDGFVAYTVDGGQNWAIRFIGDEYSIQSLSCPQLDKYWAACYSSYQPSSRMLYSYDFGYSWYEYNGMGAYINYTKNHVYFLDSLHGWMCGGHIGIVNKTVNAGFSWKNYNKPPINFNQYNEIYFKDHFNGIMIGDNGDIVTSVDSGITWQPLYSGIELDLVAMDFISDDIGYVVGTDIYYHHMILKTYDWGTNWDIIYQDSSYLYTPEDIAFISQDTGWIVGEDIMKYTNDGGITWHDDPAFVNSDYHFNSIFFLDNKNGWLCGRDGAIYKYNSGTVSVNETQNIYNKLVIENVYPNPFEDNLHLQLNSPENTKLKLRIFNVHGQCLYEFDMDELKVKNASLSLNLRKYRIQPGIYFLELTKISNNQTATIKVVKK